MDIALNYGAAARRSEAVGLRRDVQIARVEVFDSLEGAEPFWRRLEQAPCRNTLSVVRPASSLAGRDVA